MSLSDTIESEADDERVVGSGEDTSVALESTIRCLLSAEWSRYAGRCIGGTSTGLGCTGAGDSVAQGGRSPIRLGDGVGPHTGIARSRFNVPDTTHGENPGILVVVGVGLFIVGDNMVQEVAIQVVVVDKIWIRNAPGKK
jgi:hypothetical protein